MSEEDKQDQGHPGGYTFGLENNPALLDPNPSVDPNPAQNPNLSMDPNSAQNPNPSMDPNSAQNPNPSVGPNPAQNPNPSLPASLPQSTEVVVPSPSTGVLAPKTAPEPMIDPDPIPLLPPIPHHQSNQNSNPAQSSNLNSGSNQIPNQSAAPNAGYNSNPNPYTSSAPSAVPMTSATAGQPAVVSRDKFALDEVISFAWNSMKSYFWPLTGVLTVTFFIQYTPSIASFAINHLSDSAIYTLLGGLLSLAGGVASLIVTIGTINVWLKIVDGDKIAVRDVFSKINRTWDYTLASFVFGMMIGIGYCCLIIPGVYLQLRFQFYPYFISESKAGPLQALKASYAITKGSVAELFFLGLICYFLNWIGLLCFVVGIVPAQIMDKIAVAKAYRMLRANTPLSEMPEGLQQPLVLIPNSDVVNA